MAEALPGIPWAICAGSSETGHVLCQQCARVQPSVANFLERGPTDLDGPHAHRLAAQPLVKPTGRIGGEHPDEQGIPSRSSKSGRHLEEKPTADPLPLIGW